MEDIIRKKMNPIRKIIKDFYIRWHERVVHHLESKTDNYLWNIWSWCQNETMLRQGVIKDTPDYKYYSQLHRILDIKKLAGNYHLARIGKKGDGGYYMAENEKGAYSDSDCLIAYSLGIADDVSWDLFMAEKGYNVFQYDGCIKQIPVNHPSFHWERINITGDVESKTQKRLTTLLKQNGHSDLRGMILKCDIEGSEWGMLNEMEESQLDCFDQVLLELHSLVYSQEREAILSALEKLSHTHSLVYLHANNNGIVNYTDKMVTPDLIEGTFVNKKFFETQELDAVLPLRTDDRNLSGKQDILVGRWNIREGEF